MHIAKKIFTILLFLLSLTAVACQAETEPVNDTAVTNTATPDPTETAQPMPTETVEQPTSAPEIGLEEVEEMNTIPAQLDKPFALKVGETAVLENETVQIVVTAVTDDSRCPKDVACVWEGEALVHVTIQETDKQPSDLQLNTNPPENSQTYLQYQVLLEQLLPVPISGEQISQDQYEATIIISQMPN